MELSLPKLADEILANPTWIEPYNSTNDPTQERATIKHLHWSPPSIMLTDNDLLTYNPQHHYATSFTTPHILFDIPWNNNPSQLLEYLHQIAEDWRCVQLFLQAFHLYQHILPTPTEHQLLYIRFPIAEHLIHVDPLYPHDYTINPSPDHTSPLFQLYHGNYVAHHTINLPLPNRIPQYIIHAIRRLRQYHALPHTNSKNYHQYPHNGMNALFTAPLTTKHHISQHTILERKNLWPTYYPNIPIPMPSN